MSQDEYEKVELPALEQLQALGWRYQHGRELGPECSPERASFRDVVLADTLEKNLFRLNDWISPENLTKVVRDLCHPSHSGLMEYNKAIWGLLFGDGISVEQDFDTGRINKTVKLIDFDNIERNDFLCTNQFRIEGIQNIYPDIICFVNGIPLVVIECKAPTVSEPIKNGVEQLRRYANLRAAQSGEGAERLFYYNQLMISTCRDQAIVGTISTPIEHYGYWKDAYPFTDHDLSGDDTTAQQRIIAGMLSHHNLFDLMQNFTIFENNIKKVARYQQFRAVNKVIERLKTGKTRKEKSGIVWHTQGSGKSLTMVMLAMKMRRDDELKKYKLVFITDRKQLDAQLSNTFRDAQSETVLNASSVTALKELLSRDSSDLITATVQKFQDAEQEGVFDDLNASEKIIVLADEAHRTQFGGLAITIDAALPNAPKIGFTGTPLLKTQKMGQAFGQYIDYYKINEAVDDGATVPILYEGREVNIEVSGKPLDAVFEEEFQYCTDDEKREIKKKHGVDIAVREAPDRIRWVCIDLLKHYEEKIRPEGHKAMIVVGSRHAATIYKDMLDDLGAPPSAVIISSSQNDKQYLAKHSDKVQQKLAIDSFKEAFPEGDIAFLIVKDMLLTGFDAPIAQVMYVDRQLKEHTLMQAIARVNRTYKDKSCGYIVDYFGLAKHLTEALELFSGDADGSIQSLKDEIPKLKARETQALAFFKDIKSDNVEDYLLALKEESVRADFHTAYRAFAKQANIVLPDKEAKPFLKNLYFLGKVHNLAKNRYRDLNLTLEGAGEKVRQMVDRHIHSTGVDPRIPPVDLLAANFKESVAAVKSPESKASEIESALKHHITIKLDDDPEFYKSLSLRLQEIIEKTAGRWEQQVLQLEELSDDVISGRGRAAIELNLTETELAFYNIMMAEVKLHGDEDILGEEKHELILNTTKELVALFTEATEMVDFFQKDDQIARVRKTIKRTVLSRDFDNGVGLAKALQERFIELGRHKFS